MANPEAATRTDDGLSAQALVALVRLLARQAARELTATLAAEELPKAASLPEPGE